MAVTITHSDEFLSTTSMTWVKNNRSALDRPHPVLQDALAHKEDVDGGERLVVQYETQRHSVNTQLSTGYEPVNLEATPVMTAGNEGWFYAIRPIIISGREEKINNGSAKITSILERRTQSTHRGMRADFEQQLLSGDVASMSDLVTLNGFAVSTGILENAALGSQTNVVHNVSKLTYQALRGFQNQSVDLGANFSTAGLPLLTEQQIRIQEQSMDPTKVSMYASIAGASNLNRALQPNERYIDGKKLGAGELAMAFNGMAFKVTSLLPNTGADAWNFLAVDWNAIKLHCMSGMMFNQSEFKTISGHDVRAAFVHTFCQTIVEDYGSSLVAYNGTNW